MPPKHPVSLLQEILLDRKLPIPTYTCGGSGTNFTCTVTANGIKAVARSTSKKNARKAAAQQALILLSKTMKPKDNKTKKTDENAITSTKKTPIALLKEFVDSRGLPAPLNEYKGSGTTFVCTITVKDTKVVAQSTSKRNAKNAAAKKALEILRQNTTMTIVEKTPVALLQDYLCANRLATPQYTFDEDGTDFICTVQVNGVKTTARSLCQQTAKNDAAKKALNILEKKMKKEVGKKVVKKVEKKAKRRPVILLQEYMVAKSLPLPLYRYEASDAGNKFTCTLTANDVEVVVKCPTKKSARNEAAKKALDILDKEAIKTPVVLLQEYMAAKSLPLPIYRYEASDAGNEFTCTLTANDVEVVVKFPTKKSARNHAAKKALDILNKKNIQTPVVLLQEYLVAKSLPLPLYTYEASDAGNEFTCTLTTSDVKVAVKSSTKKNAKNNAAKLVLDILSKAPGVSSQKENGSESTTAIPQTKPATTAITRTKPTTAITQTSFKNYIGELNTYAMKYKVKIPTYTFSHSTLSGQYVFRCEFDQHQCEGLGVNKKDAKQESAKAMLKMWLAGKTPVSLVKEYTEANGHLYPQYAYESFGCNFTCTVIMNGVVGVGCCKSKKSAKQKAAKQLIDILMKSTHSEKVKEKKTTEQEALIPESATANAENVSEANALIQIATSLKMMKLQLRLLELGLEHEIEDVPANGGHFVVSLIVNGSDFTVYGKGETKEHAAIDAIQTALLFKKTGFSFLKVSQLFSC